MALRQPYPYIEPGVLTISRWFYGVMFALITLGLLSPKPIPDHFSNILWVMTGLLVIYLNLSAPAHRLKHRYLPIALTFATLVPILADTGVNLIYAEQGIFEHEFIGNGTRLYFWLLLPLIVISSQYNLRTVLMFTSATSLLPLLLPGLDRDAIDAQITNIAIRFMLYTIVGYLVVTITRAQRSQRAELAQKNAQLTHYAATLEQLTIARERNRLARELHDTLAHTLSAVNVQLKALEVLLEQNPSAAQASLQAAQALTRDGLQEARRALHALRAAPIEELGLRLALERLAQQTAERAGFTLSLDLPPSLPSLPPQTEQHLYRAAEEALTNAARHAHARHVRVGLHQKDALLRLTISDDGVGFTVDDTATETGHHFGLLGLKERAALVNGTLEIRSQPGEGTHITFELPLEGT